MASNPYLDRLANEGKNAHGKRSEKRMAKKLGAKQHPNSGAMRGAKSDASLKTFRMEMKSTKTDIMPLEMSWLVKIAHEALAHGQTPVVTLSFVDPGGRPRLQRYAEWVLMPLVTFQELTQE